MAYKTPHAKEHVIDLSLYPPELRPILTNRAFLRGYDMQGGYPIAEIESIQKAKKKIDRASPENAALVAGGFIFSILEQKGGKLYGRLLKEYFEATKILNEQENADIMEVLTHARAKGIKKRGVTRWPKDWEKLHL